MLSIKITTHSPHPTSLEMGISRDKCHKRGRLEARQTSKTSENM